MNKHLNNYEYKKYDNGLRLIIVPMKEARTATVLVMAGTGSRYEEKRLNGISHFLEHMMFKGTERRPHPMDISRELDSIGAEYNAFTSQEYTGYYAKSSHDKFDKILDVVTDIFLNSKLGAEELEREKGVIVEEINMYKDLPMRYVSDIYLELLYGDQPLGRQIAGTRESVMSFKRDDFVNYFDNHYFAENTVMAVAGNVETKDVIEKVSKAFKNVRQHKQLEPEKVKEEQDKTAMKIFYKKSDQTHFELGVRTFGTFDERMPILSVLSTVLGGGMSSRLWNEVREKRGLAYYVRSGAEAFLDVGTFGTSAGVNNEKADDAIKVILNEYDKIKNKKVDEEELQKAKEYIKGGTAISLESSDARANFYAIQELLKNEIETPEEKLEKINKVTADQIQELANEIFVPEKLNLALIGPFKEDNEDLQKALNI